MQLSVNFAYPVECYDNFINKCVGMFCHVEFSVVIDAALFRVIVDEATPDSYSPQACADILRETKELMGDICVCFYILFGSSVAMRILREEDEEPFFVMPKLPVYKVIRIPIQGMDEMQRVLTWQIKQLGKPYDIPRALLLFAPFQLANDPNKFICSQMMMHLFRETGLYEVDCNVDDMSPDAVHEWLCAQKERVEQENEPIKPDEDKDK